MAEEQLQKTPLCDLHKELGGKMVPFAGWLMPVQFEGVLKEHDEVRTNAGIFDISHMGEFLVEGKDTISFLQHMVTNDLSLLQDNKAQYACMCYPNGTVVDDLFYYRENIETFRVIVNASNLEKDFKWLNEHSLDFDVKITNLSNNRARFAYQGPNAEQLLNPIIKLDLSTLKRFFFAHTQIQAETGEIQIFLARTGYTGEDGFEITCEKEEAIALYKALLNTGAKPIGLGARDSLRLEACYSLYGHEINDSITPIEASIGWAIKPKEGIDFIGKEILLKQKQEGTDRVLVGINLIDRGIIRADYKLFKDGQEIGFVTSGGYAPTLKKTVGLALIKKEFKEIGTKIEIEIRNKRLTAIVVKTPFYKK